MPRKIVIVEDAHVTRKMLVNKLTRLGIEGIVSYSNSAEAWEDIANSLLDGEPYDLVITDLNMPEMDGMVLLENIKEDPISEQIPVIIVSADHDQYVIDEALYHGASAYYTKPVDFEELRDKINELTLKE